MSTDGTALWQSLLSTALVGTGRQSPSLPPTDGALGTLLSGWTPAEQEAKLLGAAGALALYRRAGRTPAAGDPASAWQPCDTEDLPVIGPRAEYYLGVVLNGDHKDLLPEWLRATTKSGKRISERYLPEVLDAGRRQTELRDAIKPVLGRRGRWLAQRNPDWKYVSDLEGDLFAIGSAEMTDAVWETGTRATRVELLEQAWRSDPERARNWVAESWSQENADTRAAFLATFARNLSMTDEPFLEQALDDRGKDVRSTAADLLARLPESHYSQRMRERAEAAVSVQRPQPGVIELVITPPEAWDKAMQRDGIDAKSSISSIGDRAWWLRQIVSAVPLAFWSEKTDGASPLQILQAARATDWSSDLQTGWMNACRREHDSKWAEALWRFARLQPDGQRQTGYLDPSLMDYGTREAMILDFLQKEKEPLWDSHPAVELLSRQSESWSEALSQAVIASIQGRLKRNIDQLNGDWQTLQVLRQAANLIPPHLADAVSEGWITIPDEVEPPADAIQEKIRQINQTNWARRNWNNSIREFLGKIQFRHDLSREVSAE